MSTIQYNKLVRDKIPDIIAAEGKTCVCETLSDDDYIAKLYEKLREEMEEFIKSGNVEELADIGEVMHAILGYKHVSVEQFQAIRDEKRALRGGFNKRLLLKEVSNSEE